MTEDDPWDAPDLIWVSPKQRIALDGWARRNGGAMAGVRGPDLLRKVGKLPAEPTRRETHAAVSRVFDARSEGIRAALAAEIGVYDEDEDNSWMPYHGSQ